MFDMFDRGEKVIFGLVFIMLIFMFLLVLLYDFPCNMEWAYCYKNP